jgi:hypothetical protein
MRHFNINQVELDRRRQDCRVNVLDGNFNRISDASNQRRQLMFRNPLNIFSYNYNGSLDGVNVWAMGNGQTNPGGQSIVCRQALHRQMKLEARSQPIQLHI